MKSLALGAFVAATAFAAQKQIEIKLPSNAGKLVLSIAKTNEQSPDEFAGMEACGDKTLRKHGARIESRGKNERLLTCLHLKHPQFSAEPESRVPVVYIESFSPENMVVSLKQLYSPDSMDFMKAPKKNFPWGDVHEWSTATVGSAHYLFLAPKDKSFAIRIGPIAGLTLAQYSLNFEKANWTYK